MQSLRNYLKEIYLLMGSSSSVLIVVFIMGTGLGLLDLGCVGLLMKIVAAVVNKQSVVVVDGIIAAMSLSQFGAILVGVYLFRAVLGIIFHHKIFHETGIVEAHLKATLTERFMLMPYEMRVKRSVGDLLTSINQWSLRFSQSVLAPLLRFFCDATVGVLLMGYFLVRYPVVTVSLILVAVGLGIAYDLTLRRMAAKGAREYRLLSEEIAEISQQALSGYKEARVLMIVPFFCKRIYQSALKMGKALAISNVIAQSPRLIIEAILITGSVITLLVFNHMGRNITDNLPELAMIVYVLLRVSSLVSLTTSMVATLRLYRGIVGQLASDYRQIGVPANKEEVALFRSEASFVSLHVSSLSFHYQYAVRAILRDVSFTINAGDALAIIGQSGSGKTTLVDLLLGLLKPSSGEICIMRADGSVDADFIGCASYLSQTPFIINDTLRRNVALGQPDEAIDDARVIEALKKAKLSQFAARDNLDAVLGDRGANISGGQRQRVTLARAFYHGYKVMILDEATNALDLATEIEIVQDLIALRPEITLITITHRPEIAKLFPRTLDLGNYTNAIV